MPFSTAALACAGFHVTTAAAQRVGESTARVHRHHGGEGDGDRWHGPCNNHKYKVSCLSYCQIACASRFCTRSSSDARTCRNKDITATTTTNLCFLGERCPIVVRLLFCQYGRTYPRLHASQSATTLYRVGLQSSRSTRQSDLPKCAIHLTLQPSQSSCRRFVSYQNMHTASPLPPPPITMCLFWRVLLTQICMVGTGGCFYRRAKV